MKISACLRFFLLCACLLPGVACAQTILVFGDSLSAAYGIPRETGWVSLLQRSLPQHQVVNASISGETTAGGLRRIGGALREHKPDILVLELGANDGLRGSPLKDTEANLASMIRQAQTIHARVLLLGMQLPPNYGAEYTARFRSMYPKLAQRHRIALVPFFLEGVAEFQADNLHPAAQAQPRIMQNVMRQLKGLL